MNNNSLRSFISQRFLQTVQRPCRSPYAMHSALRRVIACAMSFLRKACSFLKYLLRTLNRMILICARLWTLLKRSWMKTAPSFESLNEFWSPKCGSAEIKRYQRFIRPDVGVLWVGRVRVFGRCKKEDFSR